ncbi:MAG: nucleotidyltransferase domain-containing protein [Pseudomonadota bacterium]
MDQLFQLAATAEKKAWEVIRETRVIEIWQSLGATINLVGSLKTGLLLKRRDIDFHIYTNPFSLADSFSAMARLAENSRITAINYANLLEAEDKCLEWHAFYEDGSGDSWQIDLIHILNGSRYAGYFEDVAERISQVLTPETRAAILRIKNAVPDDKKVMGIRIYQAVIAAGVRDEKAFWEWDEKNPARGIVDWRP